METGSFVTLDGIDLSAAGILVANMIEEYIREQINEERKVHVDENTRPAPGETGLYLSATVDNGSSPASSGEYGTSIRAEGHRIEFGVASGSDKNTGWRPGDIGCSVDRERGFQNPGSQCFDEQSGGSILFGSVTSFPVEHGLAQITGTLCTHGDLIDRRGRLLRPIRFQRPTFTRFKGNDVFSRASFYSRAPPRGQGE